MKLFYKIHKKMFKKVLNFKKKVRLNLIEKLWIFILIILEEDITKKIYIVGAGLAGLSAAVNAKKKASLSMFLNPQVLLEEDVVLS